MSLLDSPISQLATHIPGATAIFFKHKINFCCDGQKTLSEVIQKKGISESEVLAELMALQERKADKVDPQALSTIDLIKYILSRYHEVHRAQLNELERLANRVEAVHAMHPLCPVGLAKHLALMNRELNDHMLKEESILFPMLIEGTNPMIMGPISVMRADHDDHLNQIKKIYTLTHDVTLHAEACNTWRALYLGLQEFISDIHEHIQIENEILFNRTSEDNLNQIKPKNREMSAHEKPAVKEPTYCCGSCH